MWQFFDNHWFIALITVLCAYWLLVRIIRLPMLLLRGWPPSDATHACDADGDWKPKYEEVEVTEKD
jgi:hypothetical protein